MDYRQQIIEGIAIGIIIVAIAIILFVMKGQVPNDYPETSTDINVDELQTGDIVSVSYRNHLGIFISFWSSSTWSHPGMIYKRSDKEIFVIEACRYDKEWRGVIVIPIDKWIEFNKKNSLALTKISGPRICNEIVENALSKIVT